MATLRIDGVEATAEPGMTIIQVADRIGIPIPRYCYHPGLSVVGQCRMCQVEVEKAPKLAIACNTPAVDGMVIHTNSPAVVRARKAVLEFYLLNHPLDCPICDKGGECPLQDYTLEYGPGESRFAEEKVKRLKHQVLGPHIVFDAERCILCTRCVRFSQEVTRTGELGVLSRGDRSEIGLFPGKALDNHYSGNVIDLCPVGALTSRQYRFISRPWDLVKHTESVCPLCSRGCNVVLDVRHKERGETLVRIRPRENMAVNTYWMCDEGRFTFDYHHDPRRLLAPLARRGGELRPASWDEAIPEIALALGRVVEAHGPGAVGVLASARLTTEELFLIRRLFREGLGVPHLDHRVRPAQEAGADGPEDPLLRRTDKAASSHGARDLDFLPGAGGHPTRGMLRAAGEGRLKALVVFDEDPVGAFPEDGGVRGALRAADLLVASAMLPNATTALATYVLPSQGFAEKEGTFVNFQGRIQRINRAMAPAGQSWSAIQVVEALALSLGRPVGRTDPEGIWEEMGRSVPRYRGIRYKDIGPLGLLPGGA